MSVQKKIAVVILNYNNWEDTISCAESVLRSSAALGMLILVDNFSIGDDINCIHKWAARDLQSTLLEKAITHNPMHFPVNPVHSTEASPNTILTCFAEGVYFIQAESNRGYAAGNNLGIKLAMDAGMDAVWILNNDTIVDPSALGAMRDKLFSTPGAGLCGSLVIYQSSGLVQCRAGGKTSKWTALSQMNGKGLPVDKALDAPACQIEDNLNFIYGASVMASREFIEVVGLMYEEFFLYCEEQDWAWRARGRFKLVYAPDARVYHREGATTGWPSKDFNVRQLKIMCRSRVLLIARNAPYALPVLFFGLGYAFARVFWRRLSRGTSPGSSF